MHDPPLVSLPLPRASRVRAALHVVVAALGGAALAYALRGAPAGLRARGPADDGAAVTPWRPRAAAPDPRAAAAADDPARAAWASARCGRDALAASAAPASPLDAIARAQAGFAPARDGVLRGVSADGDALVTWTDRRAWLSVDGGATWGRVLDGPGEVAAAHVDACGRVVVVRAPDGAPLALGTRLGADERWRRLPAAAAGELLGVAARGGEVAIAARAAVPAGADRDAAPAAIVTTLDRGVTWAAPIALGDVAAAEPRLDRGALAALVAPRGCPGVAPCRELRHLDGGPGGGAAAVDRYPFAIELLDQPSQARPWLVAPAAACGAALACAALVGDAPAPVEVTGDPPPIARLVPTPLGALAIPANADRDLLVVGPADAHALLGSAGFPAVGLDASGQPLGLRDGALLLLDRGAGVRTLFTVPGAPAPVDARAAAADAAPDLAAACPAPAALRRATRHNQLWLVPLAVLARERLGPVLGAAASGGDLLAALEPGATRAAGAPALPREVWMLGRGDAPACRGAVRGYYGATDGLARDVVVGAMVAGCDADTADVAALDAAPGGCKVATLAAVDPRGLPPELAAHADGAYAPDDPRADAGPSYAAYTVRVPDDGRGYAHLAVDAAADDPRGAAWSSGWRWLPARGAAPRRPEVADDFSEAITAVLYDATGPRLAIIDGDCAYAIATIDPDTGALTRRATRRLELASCNREGNPAAAWLSPHGDRLMQTM